jgi:hypothetical protein
MAWAGTKFQLSGGSSCAGTPRAGQINLQCALTQSLSVTESTLRNAAGGVACNNCCNYTLAYATPSACATGYFTSPSGMCLDVLYGRTAAGTPVQLQTCTAGNTAQIWSLNPATGAIFNPASGKCLDVSGGSIANGAKLQLYGCNGTPAQQWVLPATYPGTLTSQLGSNICAASSFGQSQVLTQNPCVTTLQNWTWSPIY